MSKNFVSSNDIRANFARAMSVMYQAEVPAYTQLLDIVAGINVALLRKHSQDLSAKEDLGRISEERHGAIRLGTVDELAMMRRVFAVMGMVPVGYYDLSEASVPVHSTAFRPVMREDLAANPFRVFCSLLRLELIEDVELRGIAEAALAAREIFTPGAIALTEQAERAGGLQSAEAEAFQAEVLETFRWHPDACVSFPVFERLIASHRLTADVVSFRGPHINHLTPRTLDIDAAQAAMIAQGLPAKAVVEGPPKRACPILLRQTAFKALDEPVRFPDGTGGWVEGHHTARFGEIEQRGVALTPRGRALYDRLLSAARAGDDGEYVDRLAKEFEVFPDDWRALYDQGLAYFKFQLGAAGPVSDLVSDLASDDVSAMLDAGILRISPIIYEDFLPVSAAGIFQSNLGDEARDAVQQASSKVQFEAALGCVVEDEFALYQSIQDQSLSDCLSRLR